MLTLTKNRSGFFAFLLLVNLLALRILIRDGITAFFVIDDNLHLLLLLRPLLLLPLALLLLVLLVLLALLRLRQELLVLHRRRRLLLADLEGQRSLRHRLSHGFEDRRRECDALRFRTGACDFDVVEFDQLRNIALGNRFVDSIFQRSVNSGNVTLDNDLFFWFLNDNGFHDATTVMMRSICLTWRRTVTALLRRVGQVHHAT